MFPVGDLSSQVAFTSPCSSSSRAVLATVGTQRGGGTVSVLKRLDAPFWAGLYPGWGPSGNAYMCVHT